MKKAQLQLLLLLFFITNLAVVGGFVRDANAANFNSMSQFVSHLDSLANISDTQTRDSLMADFWDSLRAAEKVPFVLGDSVAFLYKGNANKVSWAGDFNGWNPDVSAYQGSKVGLSNVWLCVASFPRNARLDYKIVLNGSSWILDPENPHQQWSGFGPNSELRMPDWIYPEETIKRHWIAHGKFSETKNIYSVQLGYSVNYRVYVPAGYDSLNNLPVIYVTDGHEYADDRLGSMIIVLDNLIADGRIEPILAVFIDPRNPGNLSQNRRASEYTMNERFANFVADELIAVVDSNYRTNSSPNARAILGTSLGGINSAYFGAIRHDKFCLIGIQSPAFKYKPQIYALYENSAKRDLKIFMSTGVIHDTKEAARQMKSILEAKNYPLKYIEVNEGHSWGNWRALLDEILIYFFAVTTDVTPDTTLKPDGYFLPMKSYPNPFNSRAAIEFYLAKPSLVTLELFNSLGQLAAVVRPQHVCAGRNVISLASDGLSSGAYFFLLRAGGDSQFGKIILVR